MVGRRKAGSKERGYEPALVNYSPQTRSNRMLIALGVVLLALIAATQLLPAVPALWVMVCTGVLLAAIGVMSLLAHAMGLVGFRSSGAGDLFSRAVVDGDHRGVLVTDDEGRVLFANRAYADLTGALKARDVRTVERVFARAGDADAEIYRLNQEAARGQAGSCEIKVANNPGIAAGEEARTFRIACRPLALMPNDPERSPDLPAAGLTAWSVEDVTKEAVARDRDFARLRTAFDALDAAPAGFMSSVRDGTITFMNTRLARRLEIDLADIAVGSVALRDLFAGPLLTRSTLPDGSHVAEVSLKAGATEPLAACLYSAETEGADGPVTHTIVLPRDVEAGAALSIRAERLFTASPMAIASIDPDGNIIQSNAAFSRAFKVADSVPTHLSEIAGDPEREAVDEAFAAAKRGETPRPIEIVAVGDEIIRIHMVAPQVETPGGHGGDLRESVLLYALQVTEQRALERQMADTQKNQAIGVIAGGVAHDFNNVLTAIIGFSDLLLAKYVPADRQFHDITQIRNTAFKGASLVRQLLAYTRRQTLRPKTLSMPDVLTDLSMILRRLAGESIKVEIKHGRDLWPVRADVGALERVFVNLCVNARDAINDRMEADRAAGRKPGEAVIRITTRNLDAQDATKEFATEAGASDHLLIEVSDTGTGMSKDVMAKVFDPFFTTKKAGKGTGLGLSSVVGIVEQSGGVIRLDSTEGEGTTFRMLLPRHIPTEAEQEEPKAVRKETARDLAGSATILFVEDEDSVRAFGTRTLKERGYTVHEAENGEDALEIMEDLDGAIDLIVSDVVMPEMDGPTLFRAVRETAPDLPFIFASGYAEEAFEKSLPNATEAKFGFIPKPYTLKDLASLVKDTLDERDMQAERDSRDEAA